jgi:hypothetical protein
MPVNMLCTTRMGHVVSALDMCVCDLSVEKEGTGFVSTGIMPSREASARWG